MKLLTVLLLMISVNCFSEMVLCTKSDTHEIIDSGIKVESFGIQYRLTIPSKVESYKLANVTLIIGADNKQEYSFEPRLMEYLTDYQVEFMAASGSRPVKIVAMYGNQCKGTSIVQVVKT